MNTFDAETGKFNCPNDGYALDDEAVEDDDQGQEMKTKYAIWFILSDINLIRNMHLDSPACVEYESLTAYSLFANRLREYIRPIVDLLKQTDSMVIEQYTEVMAAKNATTRTHDGMD